MAKLGPTIQLMLVCTSMIFFTTASAQCQGDFQGLIQQCSRFVQRPGPQQSPSQGCCNVVRDVDLPCVCQHVTTQVEKIISMQKAAFVSASCGKPLAHGTKCGSNNINPILYYLIKCCLAGLFNYLWLSCFAGYTVPWDIQEQLVMQGRASLASVIN